MVRAASAVAFLCLAACEQPSNWDNAMSQMAMERLERDVTDLKQKVALLEVNQSPSIYLSPADGGYSILSTANGGFTFEIKSVAPYANGSRVTVRVGNLLAADVSKLGFDLSWGTVDEDSN